MGSKNKTHTIQDDSSFHHWKVPHSSSEREVYKNSITTNSSTLMIDNRWPTGQLKYPRLLNQFLHFCSEQFLKRLQLSNILMKTTSFRKIESHHAVLEESGSSTNSQRSAHRWRYKSRMMGRVSSSHSWSLQALAKESCPSLTRTPMIPNGRSLDGWPQRLSLPTAAHFF